jgi:NAD(P)-dependent dehydrogenase (short-subunit alcohol dehydrogenase family)
MQRVLITGTSRGIGLALARAYAERGDQVFATARHPERSDALQALIRAHAGQVIPIQLDVTDAASISTAAEQVRQHTAALDILINNAGINPEEPRYERFGQLQADAMLSVLATNSVAPMLVLQAFHGLLVNGDNPRVANISSSMGSIELRRSGGSLSYCASKAALNMLTHGLAFQLRGDGVTAIALDPGWVQTDMGGRSASLRPEESANGCMRVIDGLTTRDAGRYLVWNGGEHPW